MPATYRFDGPVVILEITGVHSVEEPRAAWERAERDPAYPPNPRVCLDLRGSESLARRSVAELRSTADWFLERGARSGRRLALVARAGVQYRLMRMAATWLELNGIDVHVATDVEAAVHWLKQRTG